MNPTAIRQFLIMFCCNSSDLDFESKRCFFFSVFCRHFDSWIRIVYFCGSQAEMLRIRIRVLSTTWPLNYFVDESVGNTNPNSSASVINASTASSKPPTATVSSSKPPPASVTSVASISINPSEVSSKITAGNSIVV